VVKKDDGTYARGSKLAPWRTRLDRAGLWSQVALSPIQGHEVALGRPWLEQAPVWRAGDLRLDERGCLDGATFSHVKRQRRGEVLTPLKAHRWATQEAIQLAERAAQWEAPPSRADQSMAWVHGVAHRWAECAGPLHAWVMRCWNKKKKCPDPLVLVTTDRSLSASWIVRHDEERPEIEQDYAQMQSGGWQRQKLSATRYRELVFDGLTVVWSDSL
jgi:hypothetical protein